MTELTEDSIDELNVRVHRLIFDQLSTSGMLPDSILDRVPRTRRYNGAFTGFKAGLDHRFVNIIQSDGLVGQWLIAVAPTKQERLEFDNSHRAAEKKTPRGTGWRFYASQVPPHNAREYKLGDPFDLPPLELRQQVIDASNHQLIEWLRESFEQLCVAVIAAEEPVPHD